MAWQIEWATREGRSSTVSGVIALFRAFTYVLWGRWPHKSGQFALGPEKYLKKSKNFFFRFLRIKDAIHAFGFNAHGTCVTLIATLRWNVYHVLSCASFPALAMPTVQLKAWHLPLLLDTPVRVSGPPSVSTCIARVQLNRNILSAFRAVSRLNSHWIHKFGNGQSLHCPLNTL